MLRKSRVFGVALAACLALSAVVAADVAEIEGILKDLGGKRDIKSVRKAADQLKGVDVKAIGDAVLQESGILDSLRDLAGKTDRKVVSRAADEAMKRLGPEFGNRIQGVLGDPDKAGKLFKSIGGLGERGAGALGGLTDVVGDAKVDPSLRAGAIEALGDVGLKGSDGAVEKALQMASKDSNADVAGAASKALGKLR
jgi:hypothetical protein